MDYIEIKSTRGYIRGDITEFDASSFNVGGGGGFTQVDRVYLGSLTPLDESDTSSWQDTGLAIDVPEAGDYTIEVFVAGGASSSSDGSTTFLLELQDTSDSSHLAYSTGVFCTGAILTGDTNFDTTLYTVDVTVASAKTFGLFLHNNSGATLSALVLYGDDGSAQPASYLRLIKRS